MARVQVPRLVVGDNVVEASSGQTGIVVLSYPRRSDGQRFLMIRLTAPGCQGKQVWASQGVWLPHIHWTDAPVPIDICAECERPFRGGVDDMGLKRIFCRTCDRANEQEDAARRLDASPSHKFGRRMNRSRERE